MTRVSLRNRFVLGAIAGSLALSAFTGTAQARGVDPNQVLYAPLERSHPAAQLDPKLLNVPPIRPPKRVRKLKGRRAVQATRELVFDLGTRAQKVDTRPASKVFGGLKGASGPEEGYPGADHSLGAEPGKGDRVGIKSVIGTDNRVRITNTTVFPWRAQCKLYITFPTGAKFIGSGTLVAAKYVLTAGHCVYDSRYGGWASSIEVIPGLNGTYKPYGSAWATRFRSYTGWTQNRSADHDFALMTLDRTIGNSTGWLGYGYWSSINGVTGNIAGYPGDRDGGINLYYHSGPITSSTSLRVFYQIDTAGGQSGSGVYRILNDSRYVFGVHAYGNGGSGNSATRLDSNKFNSVKSWIASGQ